MKEKVNIGAKSVELAVNAATPLYFKAVFGQDIYRLSMDLGDDTGEAIDNFQKLAFIMNAQAKKDDVMSKTIEDYIAWLEKFLPMDIALAVPDIADVYMRQTQPTVTPKK